MVAVHQRREEFKPHLRQLAESKEEYIVIIALKGSGQFIYKRVPD